MSSLQNKSRFCLLVCGGWPASLTQLSGVDCDSRWMTGGCWYWWIIEWWRKGLNNLYCSYLSKWACCSNVALILNSPCETSTLTTCCLCFAHCGCNRWCLTVLLWFTEGCNALYKQTHACNWLHREGLAENKAKQDSWHRSILLPL